jgi:hypothetical protein
MVKILETPGQQSLFILNNIQYNQTNSLLINYCCKARSSNVIVSEITIRNFHNTKMSASRRTSTRRVSFAATAHVRLFEKEEQDNHEEQELQKTLQMFHPENKK